MSISIENTCDTRGYKCGGIVEDDFYHQTQRERAEFYHQIKRISDEINSKMGGMMIDIDRLGITLLNGDRSDAISSFNRLLTLIQTDTFKAEQKLIEAVSNETENNRFRPSSVEEFCRLEPISDGNYRLASYSDVHEGERRIEDVRNLNTIRMNRNSMPFLKTVKLYIWDKLLNFFMDSYVYDKDTLLPIFEHDYKKLVRKMKKEQSESIKND